MPNTAFLARQPILDRSGDVFAYELLFRAGAEETQADPADATSATAQVLSSTFNEIGARRVLNGRLAFVNLGADLLRTEIVELLPKDQVVIEILESVQPTPELVARLRELAVAGYRFALDDYEKRPGYEPLLDLAEFVKIDVLAVDAARVDSWIGDLRRRKVRLLAEKVEQRAQHAWAAQLGFELFQGYYFAHPETLSQRVVHPSHARIARILSRIRADWDPQVVEDEVKHDPGLTLKLLNYANSVRFGPAVEVRSVRQALAMLGERQLYRWLALMLLTIDGRVHPALAATAVARGRLCELVAARRLAPEDCDDLFLTGILSLLPALLECNLDALLSELKPAPPVEHALRGHGGPLGPFLALAESVESGDPVAVQRVASTLALPADEVNRAHLDALAWSFETGAAG